MARLRAFERRRFQETVVGKFSVSPEIAELLVLEALFFARFETYFRVPGVSSRFDSPDWIHELTTYLHPIGSLPH